LSFSVGEHAPLLYAFESTRLPSGDVDAMLAEKDCRKVARLVEPVVPPRSLMSVLKLACSDESAALTAVPLVVPLVMALLAAAVLEPVDVPAIDWIKLCTSAANCPPGPLPWEPAADVLVVESVEVLCEPFAADCACNAAMRLCRKFCNASFTSEFEAVLALEVAAVLLVSAADEAVAAGDAVTPTDESAPSMAATNPPPGGGGADAVDDSSLDEL
jgi:hypothetical protein